MKKIILPLTLLGVLSLTSCDQEFIFNKKPVEAIKESVVETMASQTISSLTIANKLQSINNAKMKAIASEEEVLQAISYLNTTEVLFDESIAITKSESDLDHYEEAYEVDYFGQTYKLYVSSIEIKEEIDKDDDEIETEVETKYEGMVVYNEDEYKFIAYKSLETENEETEEEIEFRLILDEKSYIKVKQGYEQEESEVEEFFSYEISLNGVKTDSFKVKKEIEDDKNEIKLSIPNKTYVYQFYIDNETTFVNVKVTGLESFVLKKIISNLEDGTKNIQYEQITKGTPETF